MENKGISGAPRCNAKSSVLLEWLQEKGLVESAEKPVTRKISKRIVNFFSLFPEENKNNNKSYLSLKDSKDYPGLHLEYYPLLFTKKEEKRFVEYISGLKFVPKRQFNRYAKPPRVTSSGVYYTWFSDFDNTVHNFSKAHLNGFDPQPFTDVLEEIRSQITETTGKYYNSVLINFYPDGKSALSAHSDDSKWLGEEFDVPSVSFGATRDIIFRGKKGTESEGRSVKLGMETRSLTLMRGSSTQTLWTHEIPLRARKGWRINMTFRDVKKNLIRYNLKVQKVEEIRAAEKDSIYPKDIMSG